MTIKPRSLWEFRKTIEDTLYKLGVTFDYAVFDEIHNLNKPDDGHVYENILKLIRCPCVSYISDNQKH